MDPINNIKKEDEEFCILNPESYSMDVKVEAAPQRETWNVKRNSTTLQQELKSKFNIVDTLKQEPNKDLEIKEEIGGAFVKKGLHVENEDGVDFIYPNVATTDQGIYEEECMQQIMGESTCAVSSEYSLSRVLGGDACHPGGAVANELSLAHVSSDLGGGNTEQERRNNVILKEFKCTQCNYASNKKGHLKRHMLIHSDLKQFKCSQCDYAANEKGALNKHMLSHISVKQHKCLECDYATNYKGHLKDHMVKHNNDKKFKCSQCDYAAKRKSNLVLHLRRHSDVKQFKCSECDYAAKRKSILALHLRRHSDIKQFKCSECDYAAKFKCNLILHLRTHSRTKMFNYL